VEWQVVEGVWPDHDEDVSLAQLFDQIFELGTTALGTIELCLEQLFAVGRGETLAVPVKVLILGRDPVLPRLHVGAPRGHTKHIDDAPPST
jgi:hypothetical protein